MDVEPGKSSSTLWPAKPLLTAVLTLVRAKFPFVSENLPDELCSIYPDTVLYKYSTISYVCDICQLATPCKNWSWLIISVML